VDKEVDEVEKGRASEDHEEQNDERRARAVLVETGHVAHRAGGPVNRLGPVSGEETAAVVGFAPPDHLLQREGGPSGDDHAADVDEELLGAAPDFVTNPEGDAESDVSDGGDGGDGDEDTGESADLRGGQGQDSGRGGDDRDDEGPLVG